MYNREEKERKSLSSSFSNHTSPHATNRTTSLSAEKANKGKEELEERGLVEKAMERFQGGDIEWKMSHFQQKRNLAGFKSRIEWIYHPRDIKAIFKISFSSAFFNQVGAISEGDLIIELQQVTFEMPLSEKRTLHERLEDILARRMDYLKGRGFGQQWRRQAEYLQGILIDLGDDLKKMSQSKKKVTVDKVDKFISRKEILYPAPATFSWNPLGSLCVTENRFPTMRRSIIGQPNALRKYIEATRQEMAGENGGEQDEGMRMGSGGKSSLFDWQVDEQVYLIIFNRQSVKIDAYFNTRSQIEPETIQKRDQQKAGQDSVDLGTLSRLPPKLRKAYQRYFGGGERASQFHRYDKLKVYDILSLCRQDEDDIVFLIQRIASRPDGTTPSEIAFQNHLTAYPCLLNSPLDKLRYQILANQLRKEIMEPRLFFGAFLRIFVLQNDFFIGQLQKYFRQQYRILGLMPHPQLYGLGSYCKFDHPKAELIFMDLLSLFLSQWEGKDRVKAHGHKMRVKLRMYPCRLIAEGVVGEEQKNAFLMGLFPLLIVKDREMERFQFKKVKKILSANARIISFMRKLNQLVIKFEEGKMAYLKSVLEEFERFREGLEENSLKPQRLFLSHCANCQKTTHYYGLPSRDQAEVCPRCKSKPSDIL